MTGLVLALCAACGTRLLWTARVDGRRDLPFASWWPRLGTSATRMARRCLDRVGLADARLRELLAIGASAGLVGGLVGLAVFGSLLPAGLVALLVGGWPLAARRLRHQQRLAAAHDAWPRLLEQLRMSTTELGRSVPQALFEAGASAPEVLRPAFEAAQREWTLTTDFDRTLAVLKERLADPIADAACETLLVAYQVGGQDLDGRLAALVEDRVLDVQTRKDARSRQAGVRFARRFVLLVPGGMALAGMSIGTGRAAYQTTWGQMSVTLGVVMVAACWIWAGRLLRLPVEERVFR